jgi:CheY-like chemotaxis protein
VASGGKEGACILIVDDHAPLREALAEVLELEGYQVVAARDGLEAFELLERGAPPDLILLDLMMPFVDAWEFRRWQQARPALAQIPIVVVTGLDNPAQKAASIGAVDYLVKPVTREVLLDMVARYLPSSVPADE